MWLVGAFACTVHLSTVVVMQKSLKNSMKMRHEKRVVEVVKDCDHSFEIIYWDDLWLPIFFFSNRPSSLFAVRHLKWRVKMSWFHVIRKYFLIILSCLKRNLYPRRFICTNRYLYEQEAPTCFKMNFEKKFYQFVSHNMFEFKNSRNKALAPLQHYFATSSIWKVGLTKLINRMLCITALLHEQTSTQASTIRCTILATWIILTSILFAHCR